MHVSTARAFFTTVLVWLAASGAILILRNTLVPHAAVKVLDLRSRIECRQGSCDGELSLRALDPSHRSTVAEQGTDTNHKQRVGSWSRELETADQRKLTSYAYFTEEKAVDASHQANQGHSDLKIEQNKGSLLSDELKTTDQRLTSTDPGKENAPHVVLEPSYRHNTLVRLGTDLEFDRDHQCPVGSYMLSTSRDFSPKHSNCPTLYIVGARKGGTSSLYQYVSKHPDFQGVKLDAGPKAGETFYFHKPKLGSWKHYISLFPSPGNMTGEASVSYLVGDLVPKRLSDMCGKQAKVVMLFRDPVKRLESNFLMRVKYQTKSGNRSISPVVKQELGGYFKAVKKKKSANLPKEWSKLVGLYPPSRNMVFEGLYYVHLLNWLCNFPAENILIINSEEFYQKPSKILDLVFQFLELKSLDAETYNWITSATYNKGSYKVPSYQRLSHANIEKLLEVYSPFNKALLELLEWHDHQWLMDTTTLNTANS